MSRLRITPVLLIEFLLGSYLEAQPTLGNSATKCVADSNQSERFALGMLSSTITFYGLVSENSARD